MPGEFDIIECYFNRHHPLDSSVRLGIGDDAAITRIPPGMEQVVAIDTLVEGIHFEQGTSAYHVAWKALAVNLSDLAAMGATPAWFTLALTLPEMAEDWLVGFSRGLFELADKYRISLIGGDTTRGPLTVTIQVCGFVPQGKALLRSGAQPGDHIFVTGTVGDGRAGLAAQMSGLSGADSDYLLSRLQRPEPRVAFGQSLAGIANACIDISDGLLADLGHILQSSGVGASVDLNRLPISSACEHNLGVLKLTKLMLAQGGDDYELCFTVPDTKLSMLECTCEEFGLPVTDIGRVESQPGLHCYENNQLLDVKKQGYQHF